jgi:hypothetical protein
LVLVWFIWLVSLATHILKKHDKYQMPVKKTDSSETLRTTESMKRRAHLCSRFVISLMKLFRLCGKSKRKPKADVEKIQKNTA